MKYKKRLQRISKAVNTLIEDIVDRKYEPLISHLYGAKILESEEDIIIIDVFEFDQHQDKNFNNKEVRLLKEIIAQQYPIYKKMPDAIAQTIQENFNLYIPITKIANNKPFKKIVKKKVINYNNQKKQPYVINTIRFRNKSA